MSVALRGSVSSPTAAVVVKQHATRGVTHYGIDLPGKIMDSTTINISWINRSFSSNLADILLSELVGARVRSGRILSLGALLRLKISCNNRIFFTSFEDVLSIRSNHKRTI